MWTKHYACSRAYIIFIYVYRREEINKNKVRFFQTCSGVARAFPGGRVAHPEDQDEEGY